VTSIAAAAPPPLAKRRQPLLGLRLVASEFGNGDVCSDGMLRRIAFVVSALVLVSIADSLAQAQGRLCFAREATITGTDGPDVLRGTPGNDVILGLGGDDVVNGGKGNDRICSGDGADSMRGGPGADRIDGNADADTIAAGGGKDLAVARDVIVWSGKGDPTCWTAAEDTIGSGTSWRAATSGRTSRRTAPQGRASTRSYTWKTSRGRPTTTS